MRSERVHPANAWEHWGWIWSVVFFGMLLLPLVLLIQEQQLTAAAWQRAYALTVAALLVHVVGFWGPRWRTRLRARPLYGILYMTALGLLVAGLLSIHPTFYIVLGAFFTQLFYSLSPRLAIPVAIVATMLMGLSTVNERSFPAMLTEPTFWLWVLGGICGSLIALWFNAIIDQSAERQGLIEELHEAQTALARIEREAGMLQERQRLAREIHDTLAQGLISIITHLEAADQALEHQGEASNGTVGNDATLRHHLAQAQRTARSNLGDARRVVQDLRPELLDNNSLSHAIRRVVTTWMASSGVEATSYVTGTEVPLPAECEVTLLRVVQEALANVAKHANAHTVSVTLSYMPDRVLMDVQDDGNGWQAVSSASLYSAGFGLHSMRERVAMLGGSLQIESAPGEGATLVVEIPLTPTSLSQDQLPAAATRSKSNEKESSNEAQA